MRIIFFGTPEFAAVVLKYLINETRHEIAAVVTAPDRPKGRGNALAASAVKELALSENIPVLQPETLRGGSAVKKLASFEAEVFAVAAYGLILNSKILELPKYGCVNVHASLLPKYRGASPIHYAILNGDAETGITIIKMDRGIDTGDAILKRGVEILPRERYPSLCERLAALGGECLGDALSQIENSAAVFEPQSHDEATYAPMIKKEDGRVDWTLPSEKIEAKTRAFDPWPGAYAHCGGQMIKIWDCEPVEAGGFKNAAPGTILSANQTEGLVVKTSDAALKITELQAVGGKKMKAQDYLRGRKIETGTILK